MNVGIAPLLFNFSTR